jgi:hypothetical protein
MGGSATRIEEIKNKKTKKYWSQNLKWDTGVEQK